MEDIKVSFVKRRAPVVNKLWLTRKLYIRALINRDR
jgi:hypothetical protein